MSKELLPCPFCGGDAVLDDKGPWPDGGYTWSPGCTRGGCGLFDVYFDTKAEAIAAWNTRATDQQALAERDAEVARLRGHLERVLHLFSGAWHPDSIFQQEYGHEIEAARKALGGTDAE